METRVVEELREIFSSKCEVVTSLPNPRTVRDLQDVVLKEGTTYTLYRMVGGEWRQLSQQGGSSAVKFTDLTDVPSSYSGQANKFVKVNSGETALEFQTLAGGGDMLASVYDPSNVQDDAFDMDNMKDGVTYVRSENNYTDAEKTKLTGIAAGAEVNVNADWNAGSGDAQILNKPSIPSQYTDEMAQDAVGAMINDTDTVDLTYTDATPELKADVKKQMSIVSDANGIKLSGDNAAPGNSKLYGTDGGGNKGWFDQPVGGSYTDEEAQDAVGGILTDTDTIDLTYDDGTPQIKGDVKKQMSIDSDASGLKLSGDSATPGNSKLYGTNGSGVKGWYNQPAGSEAFPVGSVFIAVVSTNPNTLLGYGTWSAFGAGRVLVGLDSGDADFDTVEETGGAKTHTLIESEMPAHTHVENAPSAASGGTVRFATDTNASGSVDSTLITGSAGGGGAHNNLQPYIVVYMWKRTA